MRRRQAQVYKRMQTSAEDGQRKVKGTRQVCRRGSTGARKMVVRSRPRAQHGSACFDEFDFTSCARRDEVRRENDENDSCPPLLSLSPSFHLPRHLGPFRSANGSSHITRTIHSVRGYGLEQAKGHSGRSAYRTSRSDPLFSALSPPDRHRLPAVSIFSGFLPHCFQRGPCASHKPKPAD